jgi:hypothetical protein
MTGGSATRCATLGMLLACAMLATSAPAVEAAVRIGSTASTAHSQAREQGGSSIESAAAKASDIGRAVAMSLIGLALSVAATVLVFKRDFKEAAGVLVVGIIAVLLATPSGLGLLRDTVTSLFGSP